MNNNYINYENVEEPVNNDEVIYTPKKKEHKFLIFIFLLIFIVILMFLILYLKCDMEDKSFEGEVKHYYSIVVKRTKSLKEKYFTKDTSKDVSSLEVKEEDTEEEQEDVKELQYRTITYDSISFSLPDVLNNNEDNIYIDDDASVKVMLSKVQDESYSLQTGQDVITTYVNSKINDTVLEKKIFSRDNVWFASMRINNGINLFIYNSKDNTIYTIDLIYSDVTTLDCNQIYEHILDSIEIK